MEQLPQTINSKNVAKQTGKRHADLMKDIRTYVGYLAEGKVPPGDFFIESTYLDQNKQERPCYECTK